MHSPIGVQTARRRAEALRRVSITDPAIGGGSFTSPLRLQCGPKPAVLPCTLAHAPHPTDTASWLGTVVPAARDRLRAITVEDLTAYRPSRPQANTAPPATRPAAEKMDCGPAADLPIVCKRLPSLDMMGGQNGRGPRRARLLERNAVCDLDNSGQPLMGWGSATAMGRNLIAGSIPTIRGNLAATLVPR